VQDADIEALARSVRTVLNFEMACTDEMVDIALRLRPHQVSLVPERRQEVTTEGGLDVRSDPPRFRAAIERLNAAGIITSCFIAPSPDVVSASRDLGAMAVELHTGPYSHHPDDPAHLRALQASATHGSKLGLRVYAGHGLNVANLAAVARIPEVEEVSIGHSVVSRAVFVGLAEAVRELRRVMDSARRPS
jgi:pyridoxine 5-phosphate synthase